MFDYDDGGDELEFLRKNTSKPPFDIGSLDFPPAADINLYSGLGNLADIDFNLGGTGGIFDAEGNINPGAALFLTDSLNADIFEQFKRDFPQEAALLDDPEMKKLLRQQALTQSGQNAVANLGPQGDTGVQSQSADKTGLAKILDDIKKGVKDITGVDAGDLAKYGLLAGIAKMAYDDAAQARKEARGVTATGGYAEQVTRTPSGSKKLKKVAMGGGIGSLEMARGGRTLPPRYLDGHSDGMEDKIPANIDGRRPAALSDGEFVIPADVVSHLGNGNSNAGAKRLYEMMDRIRTARTGNHKQGKQINPDKFMPR